MNDSNTRLHGEWRTKVNSLEKCKHMFSFQININI
jgi:hypothetical protein